MTKRIINNNKIMTSLFQEIEYNNNLMRNKVQFRYRNEICNCKNTMNKKIKVNLFNQKINNLIIIILFIFYNILKECTLKLDDFHSSIITIKINETGLQNIFYGESTCHENSKMFEFPDEVLINNEKQENISFQYYFKSSDNIIQLKWNKYTENWGCLFKNCINITEIDFSKFDFSQDIQGNMMFFNCKSVTSLNLNDFGKFKLKDAGSLFRGMISLKYINLSNFDTTEVTDIGGMFLGCTSLTSLDLSNFQFNKDNIETECLFSQCPNLEYINFKNAKFLPNNKTAFISAKKNIVFCNEDERIISRVKEYGCPIIDCSDNWRQNQKKINLENGECVDDCSITNNIYNYNNECYKNCPNGTYNKSFKCENCHPDCKICEKAPDKDSTNCKSCSDKDKYLNFGNCYNKLIINYYFY